MAEFSDTRSMRQAVREKEMADAEVKARDERNAKEWRGMHPNGYPPGAASGGTGPAAGLQGGYPPGWHATHRSGPPCCRLPPGWLCTRNAGHTGPCAAVEMLPNWQRAWREYGLANDVLPSHADSFKAGYEAGFAEGMRCPF